jgi:hypothetical protein
MNRIERAAHNRPAGRVFLLCSLGILAAGCGPQATPQPGPVAASIASSTATQPAPTATATPQSTATPATYGPEATDFPSNINPLTGQPVADPALLDIPAMLVSISHFPPTARPQAGLSFAPYVFEFSITDGETRFLTAFYGEFPQPEIPLHGGCAVRSGPFTQTGTLLGNRVWSDANGNGIQDPGEGGVEGVCVNLYDGAGSLLQKTTTDSNGYYGFNVAAGGDYRIEFVKPSGMEFTAQDVGDDSRDSDADPASGQTSLIHVTGDDLAWDAGLLAAGGSPTTSATAQALPEAVVGPVRSGRLLYAYIAGFFQDSCLIYAFASPEVLAKLPKCAFVTHDVEGGGNMLALDRFKAIALQNQKFTAPKQFNYASNVYSDAPPSGGVPAAQLNVFYASLNQSGWTYDPLYQAWLRSVDTADRQARGVLHLDVDRLNGRQLHFENVIVLMADTDVVSPTNLDIHLDEGDSGYAFLFRDGQMYRIKWSTVAGSYEKQTGFRRPIHFVNMDGSPAPLKPGHTWVIIVTPFSSFDQTTPGVYLVRYAAADGEAR